MRCFHYLGRTAAMLIVITFLPTFVCSLAAPSPNTKNPTALAPRNAGSTTTTTTARNSQQKNAAATAGGVVPDRVAWDGLRFLQQSSKFVTLPSWFGLKPSQPGAVVLSPGDVLWTAGDSSSPSGQRTKTNSFTMAPLDDVVMGGASAGTFDAVTGMWAATVTDANNGGFVGLRSTPALSYDATTCRGLTWQVRLLDTRQQSRPVKFVLRDSTDFNGVTHTYIVTLQPGLNTIQIPFNRLVPAKFAQVLNNGQCTFQKETLSGVQITYSKFEYDGQLSKGFVTGDWRLQLLSLRAY